MFTINKELMEIIVNYLSKRPWIEVAKIMEELLKLRPNEEGGSDANS